MSTEIYHHHWLIAFNVFAAGGGYESAGKVRIPAPTAADALTIFRETPVSPVGWKRSLTSIEYDGTDALERREIR